MRDGEQPEILRRYFVAHVAQISRGNAQANAVNSTDLAWSRLVRDQEDGGSNPSFAMAPGGGLDVAATKHVSLRLGEVDYLMTNFLGRPGAKQPACFNRNPISLLAYQGMHY
jgi:hypothetical protein